MAPAEQAAVEGGELAVHRLSEPSGAPVLAVHGITANGCPGSGSPPRRGRARRSGHRPGMNHYTVLFDDHSVDAVVAAALRAGQGQRVSLSV